MHSVTLYITIDHPDDNVERQLVKKYEEQIKNWNKQAKCRYRDSGFDLFVPHDIKVSTDEVIKPITIDHHVRIACYSTLTNEPKPYYLYPRSSISKTPYRMANNVGIIDSGYRGHVIAKVDDTRRWSLEKVNEKDCIKEGTRLFQVCSYNLLPFDHIKLVAKTNVIMDPDISNRGEGGFGSTSI